MSSKNIIFSMEVKRFTQNRKQMLFTFLVPILVVLALLCGLAFLEDAGVKGSIELYGANMYSGVLNEKFEEYDVCFSEEEFRSENSRLGIDKNVIVITVLQNEIQVIYDSSMITNTYLLDVASRMSESILALQKNENIYVDYWKKVDTIQMVDIGQTSEYLKSIVLPLISMVFVIILMLVNTSVSNLAIETIAGDRERGSLDLLLLSGGDWKTIVLEKYMFIAINAFLLLLVQGVTLFVGMRFLQPQLYQMISAFGISELRWFTPIIGCFVAMAMFTSALFIAISASFEKKRQATSYTGIVQIVMAMLTYVPNVLGEETLNYLPISNLYAVMENAMKGEITIGYLGGSFGISLAVTVISLSYARIILERDTRK